ncbi:MerR family transcriptional regulator [Sphingomonas sp. So64.6b]|uniref:MerR family transcriptional regulator n=1 Tax=Sphingomonas sp. So64.6b TaxID=2997354 RepID=UPI0015FF2A19|nr:MerR family transcriptional regulator [Sphingomonas sp. So64.6b]QNA85960.1 MerR family transcriptional regulator [Sphingomonas sp. So64.6b]
MAVVSEKAAGAFRTIGELSRETGIPQHILRYWETRFPQLRPLQRAGRRRYYRPEDVALVLRISALLDQQGYTIRGVQQMLSTERKRSGGEGEDVSGGGANLDQVKAVRDRLARALREDLP